MLFAAIRGILSQVINRKLNAGEMRQYNWNWCAQSVLPIYQDLKGYPNNEI
jgi:hypothetical protein